MIFIGIGIVIGICISPTIRNLLIKLDYYLEDLEEDKHGRHGDK